MMENLESLYIQVYTVLVRLRVEVEVRSVCCVVPLHSYINTKHTHPRMHARTHAHAHANAHTHTHTHTEVLQSRLSHTGIKQEARMKIKKY